MWVCLLYSDIMFDINPSLQKKTIPQQHNKHTGSLHCFLVLLCPDLRPPDNGALACDNWLHGCQMLCHIEFDIPRTAPTDEEFVCADTEGTWRPHDIVPDCSGIASATSLKQPVVVKSWFSLKRGSLARHYRQCNS